MEKLETLADYKEAKEGDVVKLMGQKLSSNGH